MGWGRGLLFRSRYQGTKHKKVAVSLKLEAQEASLFPANHLFDTPHPGQPGSHKEQWDRSDHGGSASEAVSPRVCDDIQLPGRLKGRGSLSCRKTPSFLSASAPQFRRFSCLSLASTAPRCLRCCMLPACCMQLPWHVHNFPRLQGWIFLISSLPLIPILGSAALESRGLICSQSIK